MKNWLFAVLAVAVATNATANRILWLDIRGDLSTVSGEAFGDFMDRNGVSDIGLDMMAVTPSGQILTWYNDYGSGFEEDDIGPWLLPEGGDGYAWSAQNQQINITDVSDSDTVRILAGYFDWDAIGDGPLDMNYYTALAYTDASLSSLTSFMYENHDINPPKPHWIPTTWTPVPEPSTASFAILGMILLLKRRKADDDTANPF